MALTKADFAERLFEEIGLNKREAKEMVELFFEEIKGSLENGEQVKISGFGKFELRDKNTHPYLLKLHTHEKASLYEQ